MIRLSVILLSLFALVAMPALAADYSHQEYFEHYEGTTTCLGCHRDEAETFFHSQHYQWTGETPAIVNADGQALGKKNTINNFCTNPIPAWIGITKNSRGEILSQGCPRLRLQPDPGRERGREPRVEADPVEEPGGPRLGLQAHHHAEADKLPPLPLGLRRRPELQTG
jgi:hypothetical protein